MTTTMTLTPYRTLIVLAFAALGFMPALLTHAATAQISATPTDITTGQSSTLSWNCGGSVSASLNQGIGAVFNSGSMQVSPPSTKTYTIVCTDSTSSTSASVTINVNTQGCYEDTYLEGVYGNEVSNTYDSALNPENVIFNEEGVNSLNGGATYDSQNHYQQCINACVDYGACTYKQVVDFGWGETSMSRYTCTFADPDQGTRSAKPMVTDYYAPAAGGGIHTETTWHAIVWKQSSGGSCPVLPPAPTVTLTASPTTVTSGQSSTLTWSSTNADYCTRVGGTFGNTPPTANATSGNKSVSLTATTDFYVTCYNEAGSAQASARVTVGNAPDLAASAITPTSAVAGTATSFSTTVTNSGTASTGTGFSVLFQSATSAQGANATDRGVVTTSALPGSNANRTISLSATLPTAGTWYVRACADKRNGGDVNGEITNELNENNNCGVWTQVTVTAGATYPNLTALTPSPSSAVVGTAKTFTSTITNNGGATTGAGFSNVFIVNNTADFTTPIATYTDTSPTLIANASDNVSMSHTFSAAGTFYVGVCADRNAAGAGAIVESNELESDNCKWRAVTVTTTTPPASDELTCSVTMSGPSGNRGNFTALPDKAGQYTWTITAPPGMSGSPANTSRNTWTYNFSADGYYSVSVQHADGSEGTCPLVTIGNPCTNPSVTITAVPDRVNPGETSTLTITGSGVSGSCTVTGPGVNQTITTSMCSMEDTTIVTPAISTQSPYVITCGATSATAIVNVIPKFQEF